LTMTEKTREAVKEAVLDVIEKYVGFAKLKKQLAKRGAHTPAALAAWIGRSKYGAKKFTKYAAKGKKMRGVAPIKKSRKKRRRK